MNRNDDFDRTLESWLDRQAPSQAPDRVLDAALDRVAAQSQRRSWLQRFMGGTQMATFTRVAAVGAVIAIAVLIGLQFSNLTNNVGTSPSPIPSASGEPSASPTPSGATESAEPSPSPSEAALLLRLLGAGEAGNVHLVTILDDGRVITTEGGIANPPLERHLTAAGIQLVRDELDATGLTETSANYGPVQRPGAEPVGFGGAGPRLEVGQADGDTVVINWYLFADDPQQDYMLPQPEAEALEGLLARLTTLDEWLPASAWADAARPYAPEFYRIYLNTEEWGGSPEDMPVESSIVSWPLDGTIEGFGDPLDGGAPEGMAFRCGMVSTEDGTAVIEALEAAGATPGVGLQRYPVFSLGDRAASRLFTITVEPILPLDEPTCEGAPFPLY